MCKVEKDIVFTNYMTPNEYNSLRESVKLSSLMTEQARRGLANTTFLICARKNEEAIGMGRVLFDFGNTAYIADVLVSPTYQHHGLGTEIVNNLIKMVMDTAGTGEKIMFILGATKGKESFYSKFGFETRPNDRLGCGMSMSIIKK